MKTLLLKYRNEKERYFRQLLNFNIDFKVWFENESESWLPVSVLKMEDLVQKTNLHREILPNEWIFDIDGKDWVSVRNLALKLEGLLSKYGITFNRWSSGNFLHYHVFVDDTELTQIEPTWYKKLIKFHFHNILKRNKVSIDEVILLFSEIHRAIPLVLLEELETSEQAHIDILKFTSRNCLIRGEGSLNQKTKAYKSFLSELPENQPLVKASWEVVFPDKISIWKPDPKLYDNLFLIAYWEYVKHKYELPQKQHITTQHSKVKISWIEQILNKTFSDGRKRLIDLVVLPYLINIKGLSEEEAVKICYEWALKCHEIEPIRLNKRTLTESSLLRYIKTKARYVSRKGLKPLSKENFEKWFSDCEEIISEVEEHD